MTSSASLAVGLARRGKKVAVIDFDVGLRNLDLIMGCERRVVYDFVNVIQGECTLKQALIKDKRIDTLYVLAASQTRDKDALSKEGVERVLNELTEDGFVLRYRTDETDDGLSGKEGTFLICSFWLVSSLAVVGEMVRATSLLERLLRIASPLGLYAEEFEVERSRHLGNFPQAFSHLALIQAAGRIILSDFREELSL